MEMNALGEVTESAAGGKAKGLKGNLLAWVEKVGQKRSGPGCVRG